MAGLGRKIFTAGDVLTASDVQNYLMDQTVMNFAGTAARSSAIATPTEGMVTYLADTNALQVYDGAAYVAVGGKILQVVSTTKTDTFSMSSTTFADVTGLSATITPSSATSKILVMFSTAIGNDPGNTTGILRLTRAGSAIAVGDAAGNRTQAFFPRVSGPTINNSLPAHGSFLDSPATTSATTYAIQVRTEIGGQSLFVNRTATDTDAATFARGISTITLMEVSA
jgi:hypothetical protein